MPDETMFTTRREFVAGSLSLLSAASTIPVFLGRTALALSGPEPVQRRRDDSQPILVVVQLAGGNDGLNTVVPYEMDGYYRARRQIAIPRKEVLPLKDGVGLHPSGTGLKELYDEGTLAIIQGVGYPNPNRSHFSSMDIWHTADPSLRTQSGWIGRYFDSCCRGSDPGPEPSEGIALMGEAPTAMQGEKFYPLAFSDPGALAWRAAQHDRDAAEVFRSLNQAEPGDERFESETRTSRSETRTSRPGKQEDLAQFLQRAALKAQIGADDIRRAAGDLDAPNHRRDAGATGGAGGPLERSLRLVHRMIAADMPTKVYYVSMGGFDTHAGQVGRQRQLVQQFGEAMKWFIGRLREDKLLDRVLVLSFSEFGRRVEENASGGTDHGEAGPMFVFGGRVIPGLHEKHPPLDKLHRGDLAFGCDFRRVYATVLRDWLRTSPKDVLGRGFETLRLIKPA